MIAPRSAVLELPAAVHGGRSALGNADDSGVAADYDFSVCLNAFGPADVVRRAVAQSRLDEYPDPRSRVARQAASARWNRPLDEIIFAAGAAELIYAACFAYLRPGDRTLIAGPAFGEYARAAALCGAQSRTVDLFDAPSAAERIVDAIASVRPRLLFVTTPANPTGRTLLRDALQHIADACRDADCLLVLDQAYDAFTQSPLGTPALPGHSHVLHLRSLTKDHAIAGVRVAFAVAPPDVVRAIESVRVPWSASAAAQAAGAAALSDEAIAHVDATTAILRSEAERMRTAIATLGAPVHSSTTHFFLIGCQSAQVTTARLLESDRIFVRDCTSFGLANWIRVAARTPAENDILLAALPSALATES